MSLRIGDLLTLKYADLNIVQRTLTLTEAKTGKLKAIAVIVRRQQAYPADTWLFQVHSNRAKNKPVSRVFRDAGELLGLIINTHSMCKSRCMALYRNGVPVKKIAKVLNHSNTTSRLRYLGITREEVLKTYNEYEL